jgi:Protein kinase domain
MPGKEMHVGRVIANRYAEIANTRRPGGQSEVFQAADLHQGGRQVAVKIVPAKSDDIYRLYFERETAALRKLSHPNIASLIDSGTDIDSGLYYVVLDWVDQTIKDWLAGFPEPPGWDDIAEVIALPLASALAHSHSMSVLHRDIKPGNVLWNGAIPLLADFALSKIKDQVAGASDATVVGMTSPPWAPPDQASRGSARFDVYGLAATLLQCVTGLELRDYPDIPRALDNADVPPEVLQLLRDALSTDPDQRPADGQVFHLALQTIQTKRSTRWHKKKEIAFELSGAARRALEEGGDGRSAEALIAARMGTATYAIPRLKNTDDGGVELTAEEFRLVGDQIELKLAFKTSQKIVCIWAEVKDFEQLESWRRHENAVTLDGRDFAWTASRPANPHQSALAAHELHTMLAKAVQDAGDQVSDRFKQMRLTNWSALIDAKEQLEKRLEEPIRYRRVGRSDVEFEIEATTAQTGAILDQERIARPLDEPNDRGVPATIVDVDGQALTVRITRPGADLPANGVLVRDRTPSHAAIRRQKSALSALREGSARHCLLSAYPVAACPLSRAPPRHWPAGHRAQRVLSSAPTS